MSKEIGTGTIAFCQSREYQDGHRGDDRRGQCCCSQ
jgi:hypothetical protein